MIALAEYIDNRIVAKEKKNTASTHHTELMKDMDDFKLFEIQDKMLEYQEKSGIITKDMMAIQRKMLAEDINKQ